MDSTHAYREDTPQPNYAQRAVDALDAETPGEDPQLLRLYTLLALTKGTETTLEDVHHAWAMWRLATRPDHPDLVPFDELTAEVQEYDRPYMEAIHRAALSTPERGTVDSTHAHPQDTPLADRAELRRRFVEAVHAASLMCDPGDPAQCGNGCDDLADAVLAIPELQRLREERDAWREASDADHEMHNEQRSRAEAAERKLAETYELLDQLIDDEPCRYDHHGYCQAHGWLHDGPCPVKRARHALAAREANGG